MNDDVITHTYRNTRSVHRTVSVQFLCGTDNNIIIEEMRNCQWKNNILRKFEFLISLLLRTEYEFGSVRTKKSGRPHKTLVTIFCMPLFGVGYICTANTNFQWVLSKGFRFEKTDYACLYLNEKKDGCGYWVFCEDKMCVEMERKTRVSRAL